MTFPFLSILRGRLEAPLAIAAISTMAACGGDSPGLIDSLGGVGGNDGIDEEGPCSIPREQILSGARKDGIPALTNPEMALAGQPGTGYLREDDRVIGLIFEGEAIAVPLNIMWWHEVVNLDGATSAVAVTHCPLTGSSLAFDRRPLSDVEFGVSGLLFQTNLIMYDRTGSSATESLWPQMLRGARCGPSSGTPLPMISIVETTWSGWQHLHPGTKVITENTGHDRSYQTYPYGNYDLEQNGNLLFPIGRQTDNRRPAGAPRIRRSSTSRATRSSPMPPWAAPWLDSTSSWASTRSGAPAWWSRASCCRAQSGDWSSFFRRLEPRSGAAAWKLPRRSQCRVGICPCRGV